MKTVECSSASEGLRAAAEWLAPKLNTTEVLIIGATRAAADEFARSMGADGSLGLRRLTLVQLAAELATPSMADRGLAPVTRLGAEAIAARVIHRLNTAKKLTYFDRVACYPGFPAALASTISDLRLAGVRPTNGDLLLLLEEHEKELKSRGLADLATVFELAEPAALPLLLLDVQLPSASHRALVAKLAGGSPDSLHIKINCRSAVVNDTALQHARTHLFSTERPPASAYDDSLDAFSAPGEGLEAVEVARRIRLMNVPFDRVAILLSSPERYQFLIEEALRRAGVPAYFSRGSARPDPSGRAFLALLACASEHCSASRFAEYLSLGQVPDVPAEPEWTPPDDDMLPLFDGDGATAAREPETDSPAIPTPAAWEKLLVDAAVIGGRDRWFRRLRGLEQELKLQLSTVPGDRVEPQLERLQNLERFALPLIEILDGLPKSADWGEWLERLQHLAGAALSHPESVLSALAELQPMSGIGPVDVNEVHHVLAGRLRFLRREPPHRRYGRVFVGSIEEARGRSFEVVFLPGLAEGIFPRRTFEDPLLLDDARRLLTEALPTRDNRTEDQRDLLRTALASAEKRFIYSYPSMDLVQGRPSIKSPQLR